MFLMCVICFGVKFFFLGKIFQKLNPEKKTNVVWKKQARENKLINQTPKYNSNNDNNKKKRIPEDNKALTVFFIIISFLITENNIHW